MRIQFENVDFNSRSGPNGFSRKLAKQFSKSGHELTNDDPDVRLAFIQSDNNFSPTALRLDGIYFNTAQDWERMNDPIKRSYDHASAVVVQSEFDRRLITHFFGDRDNIFVVHNGTELDTIEKVTPSWIVVSERIDRDRVWMCASDWRPHKRLIDNVRLFQSFAKQDDVLLIAGKNAQRYLYEADVVDDRIVQLGDLNWLQLISCMKAAKNFIHLAWLDHCPNVVIEARVCGCHIYCTSAGGTQEIAGIDSTIIVEEEWDFSPTQLYEPPALRFDQIKKSPQDSVLNIERTSDRYLEVLKSVQSSEANDRRTTRHV